jgi:hypothetical protein
VTRGVLWATALVLLAADPAAAQARVLVQGTLDAEAWRTDTGSTMLTRNGGQPAGLARVQLWSAVEIGRGLVGFALAEAALETGVAGRTARLEMAGVRRSRRRWMLDAGKVTSPIGSFAARRFSWRNPLVGAPDGYPVSYPYGVVATGTFGWLDARTGVLSLPAWHEGYAPVPDHAARPVIAVGVTPVMGVRLGASYTAGPYLNASLTPEHLAGAGWRAYHQRLAGLELAASAGYLELHAEVGRSSYDVPGLAAIDGLNYYGEAKYTFTPRLFIATRLERNDYPFIRPAAGGAWVARRTDFRNEEIGVGLRVTASSLVKASYRQDAWHLNDSNRAFIRPGGKAFALQLSQRFDVMSWFDRAR